MRRPHLNRGNCALPVPIHRLVAQLPVQSHVYLAFVSLPEAIFHANHTVRYPVSIRAVSGELAKLKKRLVSDDTALAHDQLRHATSYIQERGAEGLFTNHQDHRLKL